MEENEKWGLMNDFLKSLKKETDDALEPDYEAMADNLVKLIAPIYNAFVDRGVNEEAAVDLTLGLVQVFGNLGNNRT